MGGIVREVFVKQEAVLVRNLCYFKLEAMYDIISGFDVDLSQEINVSHFHVLRFAPIPAGDVERTFSASKTHILNKEYGVILVTYCAANYWNDP